MNWCNSNTVFQTNNKNFEKKAKKLEKNQELQNISAKKPNLSFELFFMKIKIVKVGKSFREKYFAYLAQKIILFRFGAFRDLQIIPLCNFSGYRD